MHARGAALAASSATGVAAVVTGTNRIGEFSVATLASSPEAIRDGRIWLVLTSGLLADRPAVPSLLGFWVVGFAVVLICSVRAAAGAALAGHTLSALGIYALIGLTRLADHHAFASVMHLPDYGLSAMIAAWLGAISCVLWSRYPTRRGRTLIAFGSIGCAGIGLALRPDVTFLDSEHLLAYAVGVGLLARPVRERLAQTSRRLADAARFAVLRPRFLRTLPGATLWTDDTD